MWIVAYRMLEAGDGKDFLGHMHSPASATFFPHSVPFNLKCPLVVVLPLPPLKTVL